MHEYSTLTAVDRYTLRRARLRELEQQLYLMQLQDIELAALATAHPSDRDVAEAVRVTHAQIAALHVRLDAVRSAVDDTVEMPAEPTPS